MRSLFNSKNLPYTAVSGFGGYEALGGLFGIISPDMATAAEAAGNAAANAANGNTLAVEIVRMVGGLLIAILAPIAKDAIQNTRQRRRERRTTRRPRKTEE